MKCGPRHFRPNVNKVIFVIIDLLLPCTLTNELTPWRRNLLQKLSDAQQPKNFPKFNGIRRFMSVLTPLHIFLKSVLILSSRLRLSTHNCLFPSRSPNKALSAIIFSLMCPTFPAHFLLLDLIILHLSSTSY